MLGEAIINALLFAFVFSPLFIYALSPSLKTQHYAIKRCYKDVVLVATLVLITP